MFETLLEKNKHIEEAIKNYHDDSTPESVQEIIKAIQFCIREKSKVLVPITNPDAEAGQEYMIRTTYSPEGQLYGVAFTNEAEIEKGSETATILYDIETFLNICLATDRLEGLAFNPWGNSFFMPRSVLRLIHETLPESDEEHVQDNARLNSAIHFAVDKHAGQLRKTSLQPYILHPMEVMHILSTMRADGNLLIAGVLHDTVEDTDASIDEIETIFGTDVAELVRLHTDDPNLSWTERKNAEVSACKNGEPRLKMLILADKLSNLRTMHRDGITLGEKLWDCFTQSKERQSWYYSEIQEALYDLKDYKNTAPMYWEMVDIYKYLFITYYFDPEEKCLYQISTHKEGYKLEKGNPEWIAFEDELPASAVEISKYEAERLEDAWNILKENE